MAWVLLGCGLVAVAYFGLRYLAWHTTSFVVTSRGLSTGPECCAGLGRDPIGRVQDVTYHQTIVERLVRAGSLTVESAGRHGQDPFPDISRPAEVQSLINRVVAQGASGYQLVERPDTTTPQARPDEPSQPTTGPDAAHRRSTGGACRASEPYRSAPPPQMDQPGFAHDLGPRAASGAGPTITQQMTELAELHTHGVITDAEYEQKRRELSRPPLRASGEVWRFTALGTLRRWTSTTGSPRSAARRTRSTLKSWPPASPRRI